jgi:hypothetical protein
MAPATTTWLENPYLTTIFRKNSFLLDADTLSLLIKSRVLRRQSAIYYDLYVFTAGANDFDMVEKHARRIFDRTEYKTLEDDEVEEGPLVKQFSSPQPTQWMRTIVLGRKD